MRNGPVERLIRWYWRHCRQAFISEDRWVRLGSFLILLLGFHLIMLILLLEVVSIAVILDL